MYLPFVLLNSVTSLQFCLFSIITYVVGVDIRSSKICELGFLNYKAKHVFYPSEKRRFRCRDDYYWASIFQVIIAFHTWLNSLWVAILYVKFRLDRGFSP